MWLIILKNASLSLNCAYPSRSFLLILVMPTPLQPLQRGCHFQFSAHLPTLAHGLWLLTGWMTPSRIMLMLFIVLELLPLYADISFALSKEHRAEKFLIHLELKTYSLCYEFWHCFISFRFIVGVFTSLDYLCNPTLWWINVVKKKIKKIQLIRRL
jgi:hypothetical protein